jgi:CO/xanthine dehydrogenase FAD-binding subunit
VPDPMPEFARPSTLPEALRLLDRGDWRLLAGGTDLYPGAGSCLTGAVLDLSGVAGLSGIVEANDLRIGAATSWACIAKADLPPALHALQAAARMVGGRQVQVAGTIGGNLCNASPAADGVPPLLVLHAEVELQSLAGVRRLPLSDFLLGPRRTALMPGEILAAIIVPQGALAGRSAFVKLGARSHLVISIAMVAARIVVDQGRVAKAAIAVGSCSAVAQRLPAVEAGFIGAPVSSALDLIYRADVVEALSPIDDVRGTADYRQVAAVELVRRAVLGALA